MKHLKITSVLLSAAICMSFVMTPVMVTADETEVPEQTTEATEATEATVATDKPEPSETHPEPTPTSNPEVTLYGDVDESGKVDILDVIVLYKNLMTGEALTAQGKRNAIAEMATELHEKGVLDGIGMQSHLDVEYPDANTYRQAIDKFNSLGLEVQITELDITDYNSGPDSDSVAKAYRDIMAEIVDAKESGANITACVFWGITDGTSWRKKGYPLLMNADYSPKKAYYSVKNAVPESEWGKAEEPTDPPVGKYQLGDANKDKLVDIKDAT